MFRVNCCSLLGQHAFIIWLPLTDTCLVLAGCYSLMGPTLKEDGTVEDPVRVDWAPLSVFTTPPGWWHR